MKLIAKNKRAFFDNEIIEKEVAGIKLAGHEVKSIKSGQINIEGAYVFVTPNGAVLRNAIVPPWVHANRTSLAGYDKSRDRELLLTKKQLLSWALKKQQLKAQIVPLAIVVDHNLIKLEIGIARPLRKYDKKERRKEREEKRNVAIAKRTKEIQQ
jgi:SsrA-binding protein